MSQKKKSFKTGDRVRYTAQALMDLKPRRHINRVATVIRMIHSKAAGHRVLLEWDGYPGNLAVLAKCLELAGDEVGNNVREFLVKQMGAQSSSQSAQRVGEPILRDRRC